MKVKELIERLSKMEQEKELTIYDYEYQTEFDISSLKHEEIEDKIILYPFG